jgi:tetratricopeptide (TPR) repeat protein
MTRARALFIKGKESLKRNWLKAYQYFLQAKALEPEFMPAYYEIADILHKKGFTERAISVLEEALVIKPDDQMALAGLANLYLACGRPVPALKYYRKIYEKLDTPPSDLYFLMGLCHSFLGHYRKALGLVKKAINLDPYLLEAYDLYGRLCLETGRYDDAESAYRYILQYDNEAPNAHYMLGVVLARQHKWDEAIREWERAIEIAPDMDDAIRELGWAWNMLGDVERSIHMLRKALELNPYNLQARIDLSAVLIGQRFFREAMRELEIALELDPENDLIEELLKEIKEGIKH